MSSHDDRKTKAQLIAELIALRQECREHAAEIERLRASEDRYQQLVERSPDAIIVHNGREVLFANPAAAQLVGASTPHELVGCPITRLVAASDLAIVAERMRQVLSGVPVPFMEERLQRLNGQAFEAEVASYPLIYQGQRAAQVIARDITARRQAERTLRQHNEYLAALQDTMLGLMARHDVDSVLENIAKHAGQVLDTEHVFIALVAPDQTHLEAKISLGALRVAADVRLKPGEGVAGVVWQTGRPLLVEDYDAWSQRSDGVAHHIVRSVVGVPLMSGDRVMGVLGGGQDRTSPRAFTAEDLDQLSDFARLASLALDNAQLLATERAARQQAETLQAAARALGATLDLPQVLQIILSEQQKVVPYDSSSVFERQGEWLRWVGGDGFPHPEELIGLQFHVNDRHSPSCEVMRTRAPVIYADVAEFYAGFKAEPHAHYHIHAWLGVPMFRGDEVIGMLALDKQEAGFYTPQHAQLAVAFAAQAAAAIQNARLYEQIRQHASELEQRVAERTRALTAAYEQLQLLDQMKDEFVTRISHELRTPLANVRLYASLLEKGRPEKHGEYLATLKQEGDRLNKLIEDLLDISELDMGRIPIDAGPTDLHRLIGDLLLDHGMQAEARGLTLRYLPGSDLPLVWADPALLIRVIASLLSNALNYTPAGGSITCATALQSRNEKLWVTLTVKDTGPGISSPEMPRLFERFYRGQAARNYKIPGTGLGLAISKEIMHKLGGFITVESQPHHGAAFILWLQTA
jgi:PAS domain S-box-containing protein